MNKYVIIGIVIVVAVVGFFFLKREVAQAPAEETSNTTLPRAQQTTPVKKDLPPAMETGTIDSPNY